MIGIVIKVVKRLRLGQLNKLKQKTFVNRYVYNNFFELPNLVLLNHRVMTKDAFLKKLGKNIARLREEAGLSQTELALRCDKDRQSLNRLEKGRINPSVFYLLEIANELKVPVKDLLDF